MLSILLTFAVLALSTYFIGRAILIKVYGVEKSNRLFEADSCVILGIAFATVFANLYSLLGGVSCIAFVIYVLVTSVCAFFVLRVDGRFLPCMDIRGNRSRYILVAVAVLSVILWTNVAPQHYDTYLYHAQAIHWTENYGVVCGLGNLHFRLAYNSSFMSLQALFGFKWLTGQSLHTVNGFLTLAYIVYVIMTTCRKNKISVSDVIKVCSFLYVFYNAYHISSPNTDTCALLTVLYVFVKWVEISEKENSDSLEYGFLCVTAVFAASLKLSAGILVLFAIFPAVSFIREKQPRRIISHLLAGIVVIAPYLIRNVILSGYIIYPYEKTGIKSLKWIMPEAVLAGDKADIIAWGRGNCDVSRNSEPLWQWIGEWFGSINILWKAVFPVTLIAMVFLIVIIIKRKMWKSNISLLIASVMGIVGLAFWMFTAPLPRYGVVYMIVLIGLAAGLLLQGRDIKDKTVIMGLGAMMVVYLTIYGGYEVIVKPINGSILIQADYDNKETICNIVNGYTLYTPVEGDRTGYEPFPSAVSTSNGVSLLGEDISEGFYAKQ